MVELDHPFTTSKPIDESCKAILDLDQLIPCVEGGSVLERTGHDAAKAEGEDGQITDKAASMGEGVVQSLLDALIKDFTGKLAKL